VYEVSELGVLVHNSYARTGPKLWPRGPHNQTIQARIASLKKSLGPDWKHIGGGTQTEFNVRTPDGLKSLRRLDITFQNRRTGEFYHENVGRTYANGSPVNREVLALDDLEAVLGFRPAFTPYDR
jgi:hypothetical protein